MRMGTQRYITKLRSLCVFITLLTPLCSYYRLCYDQDLAELQHHRKRLTERVGSAPALGAGDGASAGEQARAAALLNKSASADSGLFYRAASREVPKKKVRFSNVTNVVLVPTRQDYFDHNLDKKLWWTEEDYEVFKKSAVREVSALINIYRIDAKTALARLGLGELASEATALSKSIGAESGPMIMSSLSDGNLPCPPKCVDDGAADTSTSTSATTNGGSEAIGGSRGKAQQHMNGHGCTEVHTSINALPASAMRLPSPKRGNGSSSTNDASSSSLSQAPERQGISLGLGVTPKTSSALHPLAYMAGF